MRLRKLFPGRVAVFALAATLGIGVTRAGSDTASPPAAAPAVPGAAVPSAVSAPTGGAGTNPSDNPAATDKFEADCSKPPAIATSPSTKLLLDFASNRIWQPFDGKVEFKITAPGISSPSLLDDLHVVVCFGWPRKVIPHPELADSAASKDQKLYSVQSTDVRVVRREGTDTVVYETSLPAELWDTSTVYAADDRIPHFWRDWASSIQGRPYNRYNGWGVVPLVNMRVIAQEKADLSRLDSVLPVGITYHLLSLAIALLSGVLFWLALWSWSKWRKIQGGVFLTIIANRNNYASLSQFQILIWTFVIGAGAIYVMALTGGLIDIPTQALVLLGISGASALTAAVAPPKSDTTTAGAGTAANVVVGVAGNAQALSAGSDRVALFWRAPAGGTPAARYGVRQPNDAVPPVWGDAATAQILQASNADPFAVVTGAKANRDYLFRIVAYDANGLPGEPAEIAAKTAPAPVAEAASAATPAQGRSLTATADRRTGHDVSLSWTNAAGAESPDAWIVQYRVAGSRNWTTAPDTTNATTGTGGTFTYLLPALKWSTSYEFRVAPVAGGDIAAWSAVASLTTATRMPRWSDLVVWDGIKEVDITRVQMLAFTVLAAGFVVLKIGTDGDIPVIPDGILTLIGISNGVYVGAKFITPPK